MDRNKYLEMRRTGQYDFSWFYGYYIENKQSWYRTYDFQSFATHFNMILRMDGSNILNHMDKMMNVTKIENEQGHLLYIN